ncbi:lipid storage droplets surface-binding protein 2-like [Osmia lignaria lignaria]|uniref:lipid storage droplets surface-binding protein 2-like n=1 Tax=Osmia lignaria lignaria TaxID=1437193 RepID=UPI00402B293B
MTTEVAQLPHIEVFHRLLELPVVESAISKSAATYSRVKDSHQLVHWTFTTAEVSLSTATNKAVPTVAPIVKKLENLIHFVDHTLCLGLDKIEEKVPLVKEKPEQILENAYMLALQTLSNISLVNHLIISQAVNLRDKSWDKANQILETQYGSAAVRGIDNTADIVDKLIDKYFLPTEDEEAIDINTNEKDKLLHTLHTVSRLSNKAVRRVYSNIMFHLRVLSIDNFKAYIRSVAHFLQFTNYLHTLKHKEEENTPNMNNTTNAEAKKVN